MEVFRTNATLYEIFSEHNSGNTDVAAAKRAIGLTQAGHAHIPEVDWSIALSIGIADIVWDDDFYNSLK